MNRKDLIQLNGQPKSPPETITELATAEDGTLYRLEYSLDSIKETE